MSPRDRNKLVVGIPTLLILLGLILGPTTVRYIEAQTQPMPVGFTGGTIAVPFKLADGTAAAPGLVYNSAPTVGWARLNNRWTFISGSSVGAAALDGNGLNMGSGVVVGWLSTNADSAGTPDIMLQRVGVATLGISNALSSGKAALQTSTAVTLALPAGSIGLATSATSSAGNTGQGARLVVVCGPTTGTASLLFYAGTTNTPVVLANAVGGGLIGC